MWTRAFARSQAATAAIDRGGGCRRISSASSIIVESAINRSVAAWEIHFPQPEPRHNKNDRFRRVAIFGDGGASPSNRRRGVRTVWTAAAKPLSTSTAIYGETKLMSPGTASAVMGMTLRECRGILVESCVEKRGIALSGRQMKKAWIPALLFHRYDRGIRDAAELNRDNAYYKDNAKINWAVGGAERVDLRRALEPHEDNVHAFLRALHGSDNCTVDDRRLYNFSKKGKKRAGEFLVREKMALLATEARRVVRDGKIPFLELTGLESQDDARRLCGEDPGTFLSLFARAVALLEKGNNADDPPDFSQGRHGPPSLEEG